MEMRDYTLETLYQELESKIDVIKKRLSSSGLNVPNTNKKITLAHLSNKNIAKYIAKNSLKNKYRLS